MRKTFGKYGPLEGEIEKYGAAQYSIVVYPTKVGGAVGAKLRS